MLTNNNKDLHQMDRERATNPRQKKQNEGVDRVKLVVVRLSSAEINMQHQTSAATEENMF
jgi:hypothetical protein